jgi:hypothetical protein
LKKQVLAQRRVNGAIGALENVYEIYPAWRYRYAPGVSHNEHVFGLCLPAPCDAD